MPALPADVALIDDMHLGQPHVIATYLLRGDAPAIVDPGPASTIDTLAAGLAAEGLRFEDLHAILLTHIHLDHAGATGVLLRRFPHLRVYVHARGAPHLADPSKLIVSATRLYGDAMERLWGEIVPVPAQAMTTLSGGEELQLAGRRLRVFDAPGHASHHVVYFDQASGAVWMGDNGGVCMPGLPVPRPATPPPDIDIDAWLRTLDTVGALGPRSLLLTHFGPTYEPAAYLADYRAALLRWAAIVREGLRGGADDASQMAQLRAVARADLGAAGEVALFERASSTDLSWQGLARYWRRRGV
ncbi:MBL fold metallo-hydrolase [Kouleothrix sp.]|uniref:MBL fold metallo-hydrolase n=1 Tax=Kouleothrix sp. TaxID=2779161 RepID=UPI00391A2EEE